MSLFEAVLPSLVAGGFSFLGGERRNEEQVASAREQMAFQERLVNQQLEFQERMSSTAHRRQVRDLRRAGLNPILSARYGGASTPGGASAAGAMAQIEDSVGKGVSSALQARSVTSAARKLEQDVKVAKETEKKTVDEQELLKQQKHESRARELKLHSAREVDYANAEAAHTSNINQIINRRILLNQVSQSGQQLEALRTRLEGLREEEKIDKSTYGKILRWLGRMNPFSSSARDIGALGKSVPPARIIIPGR
jgi:hypothetical protein